jgi:hypothetical protein
MDRILSSGSMGGRRATAAALLREAPAEQVPLWREILADRAHQPGAEHVNAW